MPETSGPVSDHYTCPHGYLTCVTCDHRRQSALKANPFGLLYDARVIVVGRDELIYQLRPSQLGLEDTAGARVVRVDPRNAEHGTVHPWLYLQSQHARAVRRYLRQVEDALTQACVRHGTKRPLEGNVYFSPVDAEGG